MATMMTVSPQSWYEFLTCFVRATARNQQTGREERTGKECAFLCLANGHPLAVRRFCLLHLVYTCKRMKERIRRYVAIRYRALVMIFYMLSWANSFLKVLLLVCNCTAAAYTVKTCLTCLRGDLVQKSLRFYPVLNAVWNDHTNETNKLVHLPQPQNRETDREIIRVSPVRYSVYEHSLAAGMTPLCRMDYCTDVID